MCEKNATRQPDEDEHSERVEQLAEDIMNASEVAQYKLGMALLAVKLEIDEEGRVWK